MSASALLLGPVTITLMLQRIRRRQSPPGSAEGALFQLMRVSFLGSILGLHLVRFLFDCRTKGLKISNT